MTPTPRVVSYDVFRGILLLAMVVFHGLVNFTAWSFNQELFYWVPLGFILFLGVVLGQFLVGRTKKKLILAVKLLLCFLILNIPNFLEGTSTWVDFARGDSTLFSFEILFPMSGVVFATLLLDRVKGGRVFLVLCLGALLALTMADLYSYNLCFLLYGLVGYFLARELNLEEWGKRHASWTAGFVLLGLAPFLLTAWAGLYDVVVLAQVLGLYFVTVWFLPSSKSLQWLGQHSFALYVGHILLIRGVVELLQ